MDGGKGRLNVPGHLWDQRTVDFQNTFPGIYSLLLVLTMVGSAGRPACTQLAHVISEPTMLQKDPSQKNGLGPLLNEELQRLALRIGKTWRCDADLNLAFCGFNCNCSIGDRAASMFPSAFMQP